MRTRDHRPRDIDPGDFGGRIVIVERQPGADPDLQDTAADGTGRTRRRPSAIEENRSAERIVDGRPARIGLFHRGTVGIAQHVPSRIVALHRDEP